jgi:hypothetical protein
MDFDSYNGAIEKHCMGFQEKKWGVVLWRQSFKFKPSNFMSDFSTNLPFPKWFCIFPSQLWTLLLWCILLNMYNP